METSKDIVYTKWRDNGFFFEFCFNHDKILYGLTVLLLSVESTVRLTVYGIFETNLNVTAVLQVLHSEPKMGKRGIF